MVEHSPQILASEVKTTIATSNWRVPCQPVLQHALVLDYMFTVYKQQHHWAEDVHNKRQL